MRDRLLAMALLASLGPGGSLQAFASGPAFVASGAALRAVTTLLPGQQSGLDFAQDESWYCQDDVDVIDGKLVVSAGGAFRTPVNRQAPFTVDDGFSVSATIETATTDGGGIVLYGALPAGEWWQGIKRIDLAIQSGGATVAIYDGTRPAAAVGRAFPVAELSALADLELQKTEGQFVIRVNGAELGRLNDPGLFASGRLYVGVNVAPGNEVIVHSLRVRTGAGPESAIDSHPRPSVVALGRLDGSRLIHAASSSASVPVSASAALLQGDVLARPGVGIPPSLFGLHIHRAATTTAWPSVAFSGWRLWDADVAWQHLEPQKGDWRFETLDRSLALAEQQGVEVLLTLGSTPTWASARPQEPAAPHHVAGSAAEARAIEDWRNYVRTVATRYQGRIRAYEIWNEPNLKQYYSGSVDQMVILAREAYQALKAIDPSAIVVSPSATEAPGRRWLDEYLAKGGGQFADVIGFHFYSATSAPEAMIPLVKQVKESMASRGVGDKPLWNTETGWLIARMCRSLDLRQINPGSPASWKILSAEEAAAYVGRAYVLAWGAGVDRFYWYAWDNGVMGLAEPRGRTIKPAAMAYAEVAKWLVGARLDECSADIENTWRCQLTRDDGSTAWMMWNPDKSVLFDVPESWGVQSRRDLSGEVQSLSSLSPLLISPSPLLLEMPAA